MRTLVLQSRQESYYFDYDTFWRQHEIESFQWTNIGPVNVSSHSPNFSSTNSLTIFLAGLKNGIGYPFNFLVWKHLDLQPAQIVRLNIRAQSYSQRYSNGPHIVHFHRLSRPSLPLLPLLPSTNTPSAFLQNDHSRVSSGLLHGDHINKWNLCKYQSRVFGVWPKLNTNILPTQLWPISHSAALFWVTHLSLLSAFYITASHILVSSVRNTRPQISTIIFFFISIAIENQIVLESLLWPKYECKSMQSL